jgi:glycosyltransferase involved in cell wall biosynthesis
MRVAFLTWRDSAHPDGGGSEIYVEEVGRRLAARGHEVTIFCARYPGSLPEEELDGIRFVRRGGRLTVYPRGLWWLASRARADVVVDVINGVPFGTPLVRRTGVVALVHHLHQRQWHMIYPGWRGRIGWFVESRVVPRLYRHAPFLTVSEATRRELGTLGIEVSRVSVARNGARTVRVATPRSATPRVSVLCRLVPHKQVEHVIAAAVALAPTVPGLHVDVIGEGWWRSPLEHEIRRLGADRLVTLHGHVSDAERDRMLAESWIMVLPSSKEGWGLAVTEAAVQGTPAIGYRDAGGLGESIVDGATGLLTDPAGLPQAIADLLSDEIRRNRLGEAAARRAAGLSWEETADAVERVLEAATVRNGRRS